MIIIKEILKKIILLFLSIKVIYVLRGLDLSKKNLFIDLGTNLGQGFNYFIKFFKLEKFDYLLVEPNPNLKDHINSLFKRPDLILSAFIPLTLIPNFPFSNANCFISPIIESFGIPYAPKFLPGLIACLVMLNKI